MVADEELDPIPIDPSKTDDEDDMALMALFAASFAVPPDKWPRKQVDNTTEEYGDSLANANRIAGSRNKRRRNKVSRRFSKVKDDGDNGATTPALECREIDVLLGRGGHASRHPGNLELLRMVRMSRKQYKSLDKSIIGLQEKKAIVQKIVSQMLSKGSRFLHREKKGKNWREASYRAVFEKVSHMLRD